MSFSTATLYYTQNARNRDSERYGLFYKRECQEHFSPSAGCAGLFRDIQSLSPEKTLVWCRALGCSISADASSSSSDNADRFLKLASARGCTVSTMVLSEARGLLLFRVIREGIGLTQRLSATGTVRLQAIRMLTLEPERLKNQLTTTRKRSPEMEGLFT